MYNQPLHNKSFLMWLILSPHPTCLGDIEKKHKLEVSPLCDSETNSIADVQIGKSLIFWCQLLHIQDNFTVFLAVLSFTWWTKERWLAGGRSFLQYAPAFKVELGTGDKQLKA